MKSEYKSWTKEEEKLLVALKQTDMKYKEIAEHFIDRTPIQLKSKFESMKRKQRYNQDKKKITRQVWTKEEEQILLENAHKEWKELIPLLPNRTIKSMKHRLSTMNISRKNIALSDEHKQYILDNYLKKPISDISEEIQVNKSTIYSFLNARDIKVSDFVWEAQEAIADENGYSFTFTFRKVNPNA